MTLKSNSEYWDIRANLEYMYKNEKYYTITAIPYYYRRRKIILATICKYVRGKVCDFGCGDGEYIKKISTLHKECSFHGVDISKDMIEQAKARNKNIRATWEVSGDGIHADEKFQVIYSSAVFAHIEDEIIEGLFKNIFAHLEDDGLFLMCEQTAPMKYNGGSYTRRPMSEYISLLRKSGFNQFESFTIDFWLHRILFERKIGKWLIKRYMKKYGITEKNIAMIQLNKRFYYKILSNLFSLCSFPRILKKQKDRWGYCFIIAGK